MKRLTAILLTFVFLFVCVSCRNESINEQTATALISATYNVTTDTEFSTTQAETEKTEVVSVSSTTKQNNAKTTTLKETLTSVVSTIRNTKAEKTTKAKTTNLKTTRRYFDDNTTRKTQTAITSTTQSTTRARRTTTERPSTAIATMIYYISPTVQNTTQLTTKSNPTCTIFIDCSSLLNNMNRLSEGKRSFVPSSGKILDAVTVEFEYGETVFDILKRACATNCCSDNCEYCQANGIQLEYSYSAGFGNYYVEGIHQIYEKDCGSKSGWMFKVNGAYPNEGCSSYKVKDGDRIEWVYTCNLGEDIGASV